VRLGLVSDLVFAVHDRWLSVVDGPGMGRWAAYGWLIVSSVCCASLLNRAAYQSLHAVRERHAQVDPCGERMISA
jgi:hypothetical protein